MEQHPVPQNVTTFQFRLIGDMTIKQFGYLAGGAILGYIGYKLPLPLFLNYVTGLTFVLGGVGFAFVPIEERPMDVWVLSFFKSVYNPTQYVWNKTATATVGNSVPTPLRQGFAGQANMQMTDQGVNASAQDTQGQAPGSTASVIQGIFTPASGGAQQAPQPNKSKGPLDWLFDMLTPIQKSASAKQAAEAAARPTEVLPQKPSLTSAAPNINDRMDFSPPPLVRKLAPEEVAQKQQEEQVVVEKLKTVQKELTGKSPDDSRVSDLQKQLTDLMAAHDQMQKELSAIRTQQSGLPPVAPIQPPKSPPIVEPPSPASQAATGPNPTMASPVAPGRPTVQVITPDRAVKVGLPRLTTFPNVVTGIVKDYEQNLLPGVLVTVKDQESVPLRALKTNRLGQFAASTQLPNGVYLVEIEDPRQRFIFDRAQITLNGSIVPAIEIIAKSEKAINRARLEKEIFGTKT